MIEITSLRCNYCGGSLIHQNDNVWQCDSCGKFSIVNVTAESAPSQRKPEESSQHKLTFRLIVSLDGKNREVSCSNGLSLKFSYKKRATMADKYPAEVTLESDAGPRYVLEDAPRFEYGKIVVSVDLASVTFDCYKKGCVSDTICVKYNEEVTINGLHLKVQL